MVALKGPYDPVKVVEGMFNGSVTRIAYALKDPADYSSQTKTVLAECAKKFHDALDDCEIQLLDAKWYLEQQLRTNRLRREAQAREMGTAAKRKHDEIKEVDEADAQEETAAKKAKVEQDSTQKQSKEQTQPKESIAVAKPVPSGQVEIPPSTKDPEPQQNPKVKKEEKKAVPAAQQSKPPQPVENKPQNTDAPKPVTKDQAQPDDFAKPTPQATPTGTNDDFNFESMFGDPAGDQLADSTKDDNDLNFDFSTNDFDMVNDTEEPDANSLELLPGLESYANQTDDNLLTTDIMSSSNNNNSSNNVNNDNNTTNKPANPLPSFSNDFDLPNLGEPNIFDDFLNDDSLGMDPGVSGGGGGGGMGGGGGGNFEDNIDLSDQGLLDFSFDDFT